MPTDVSRRSFLGSGGALVTAFGFDLRPARAAVRELKISRTTQTHSVCPYCAVGCSVVIHTLGDKAKNVKPAVVHIEGDPESPINRGTLCPKGASLKEFVNSDRRLTQPLYRAPGASEWRPITWDQAYEKMREKVMGEVKRAFRPEFLNRIDGTVVFHALNQEHIREIVDLELRVVEKQLQEKGMTMEVTEAAKDYLSEKGYDEAFGARPLRRLIQDTVEDQLSEALLEGRFEQGGTVIIDCQDGEIVLRSGALATA